MHTHLVSAHRALCVVVAALGLITAESYGQTTSQVARVTIPVPFQYGSQLHPAGPYTLAFDGPSFLVLKGAKSASFVVVRREDAWPHSPGKLVLHLRHGHYQVDDLWLPGRQIHVLCLEPKLKAAPGDRGDVAANSAPVIEVGVRSTEGQ